MFKIILRFFSGQALRFFFLLTNTEFRAEVYRDALYKQCPHFTDLILLIP
jgi:hypothetical protein